MRSLAVFPSLDPPRSAADVLLELLEEEGVTHVFGVPGGPVVPLYQALATSRVRHVLAKHEGGAAFMAAGYARVRRAPGVCVVTTGPGATNALTGIASAYMDCLPVLVLSGQTAPRLDGRGAFQESGPLGVDLVQLFKPVTKLSMMVPCADRLADLVAHALRVARSGRPGPVHLGIPAEILGAPSSPRRDRRSSTPVVLDVDAATAAARLLAGARRPAILAGHGVSLAGASAPLLALAERLGIPVATSPKAKGVFPEHHRLSLGVLGFAGHPRADAYLLDGDVDVLLVAGTSLGEWTTHGFDPRLQPARALIQIDVDPAALGRNYPVDVGVVGDAGAALAAIDRELSGRSAADADPLATLRARIPRHLDVDSDFHPERAPLRPQQIIRALQEVPGDPLVFIDIGHAMSWAGHYLECRTPDSYVVSLGFGSMGSGLAGAIGGQLAAPDRPVIALVGDGAFAMNGLEIHTAVEEKLPITWIVLNNGGLGMIQHGARLLAGEEIGACEFRSRLDVAGIAAATGARHARVSTAAGLAEALVAARSARRSPCVIDARVDASLVPCSLSRRVRALAAAAG